MHITHRDREGSLWPHHAEQHACIEASNSEEKESLVPPGTVRNRLEPSEPLEPSGTIRNRPEPSEPPGTVGIVENRMNTNICFFFGFHYTRLFDNRIDDLKYFYG
uniref:Uncharacterized protein n=1 Tax=Anopheles culicifacies TaxID=139723 RepID=A0A182M5N1_9DIPT